MHIEEAHQLKLDFGPEWGKVEMSLRHDDQYGRTVFLMHNDGNLI